MMKEKTLFAIGIWVFCLPYLGFPVFWKNLLFVATGLFVCMLAYLMYRHKKVLLKLLESGDNDIPAQGGHDQKTHLVSSVPNEEEKVVFKSEYNPVDDAQTPKVSPYTTARSEFKTFYEEKTGPLIHRVTPVGRVDTVSSKPKIVRKRKIDTISSSASSGALTD